MKIEIFESLSSIYTQSYIDSKPVGTIHLEKMKYGKEYDILIKGIKWKVILTEDNHLLFIP